MKFTMVGNLDFEAITPDEALLKLGLYFIAQMDNQPIFKLDQTVIDLALEDPMGIDMLGMLYDSSDVITRENSVGGVEVLGKGVFEAPEAMQ